MSKLSLQLQAKSLREMKDRKPYTRKLFGLEYLVLPKVYKGSTDTELFCEVLPVQKGQSVWDIGTGTGLVAFAAKKKGAGYILATDLNPNAVENAKKNAELLGLDINVKKANVFGSIKAKFDLITFNPPFTDNEAKDDFSISFWDKDHVTVRKFFAGVKEHLNPKGHAFIAWSSFGDVKKLKCLAAEQGFKLRQAGKRQGKRAFVYYIFEILFSSS